jgi:hypothetical protein
VKTTPTAGAVWGDDQQFYGGALEKLAKYEYRLSLESNRILRQLSQRQKAREEDQGGDDFMARLDALREAREERATAGEPQISQIDADEQRQKKATAEPRISRKDTDELRDGNNDDVNLRSSAESAVPNPLSHATEPKPISGNLQNELPPREKRRTAEPRISRMDTEDLEANNKADVNLRKSVQSAVPNPQRQTWVGSN